MPIKTENLKKALVSIIVPCYNVEKYINKGLKSVLDQTYPHWECIVVNDGSTDNTEKKIKSWAEKDARFKLISQENKGLSGARNTGMNHASGDCMYFFDPDDLLDSDCLKNLMHLYEPNVDIVIGKNAEVYNQTTTINKTLNHAKTTNQAISNINFLKLSLEEPFSVVVWNKLYNSNFILSNNLTFKKGVLHEDEMWFFETMFNAKKIIFNSKVTYYYNTGNQNSITKKYTLKNLNSCIAIIKDIYSKYYIKEENIQKKAIIGAYILNLQITSISAFFRFTKKHKNVTFRAEGISIIKKHLKQLDIQEYAKINTKKTKQFKLFKRYAINNPEIAFRLIRNTNKKSVLKRLESFYLKSTLSNN